MLAIYTVAVVGYSRPTCVVETESNQMVVQQRLQLSWFACVFEFDDQTVCWTRVTEKQLVPVVGMIMTVWAVLAVVAAVENVMILEGTVTVLVVVVANDNRVTIGRA